MKKYLFFLSTILFANAILHGQSEKPNLIFIMVDDLGWRDTGFMNSPYYQTPNLDMLATQSTIYSQAYAGAANCAPSRAVLMSGQYPTRHGIYTVSPSARGDASTRKLIPTSNIRHFADSMVTFAEALKTAGYVNAQIGKWHLSKDPLTQGFDINHGGSAKGNPGKGGYFSPYNLDYLENGPEGEYLTDRLTTEAISFLEAQQDTHFFLYLPFYTVHTPLNGPQELVEKYEGIPSTEGQGHKPDYSAMVERMDASIGRILAAVSRLGLENTLIVFTSDNGGIATVSRQWPLRAGKGSYYEGGIRVPLMMYWPGNIARGQRSDLPVTFLDLFPSLLSLLEVDAPEDKILDGTDLSPYLLGQPAPESIRNRSLIWHFPIYLQAYKVGSDDSRDPLFRTRPGSIIRQGDWKLHEYFEDGGIELYNLREDPGERINLVESNPEVASRLFEVLTAWREQYQAPVPTALNPEYIPD